MLARTSIRILTWGLTVGLALPALAQPSSPDAPPPPSPQTDAASAQAAQEAEQTRTMQAMDDEARQHFQIGRTLLDAGRFDQAADEFQEAYRLSGRPQLLYNVYVAQRDGGHLDAAIEALRAYLDKVPDAPDRINLRARLRAMEEQAVRQREAEANAKRAEDEAARARAEAERNRTRKVVEHSVVPWVLIGTGAALGATSIVTGVLAKNKADDLDSVCSDSRCPASEQGNIDSAKTLAITTDVLWTTGAATAVTGLVLWLTGALDEEREVPVAGVSLTPQGFAANMQARF